MNVTGKSRILGIFGDPVAHSLSPLMQNLALERAGIDAVYVPFNVRPDSLAEAVQALRVLQVGGINVTIPHKEKILPLLDELTSEARLIGAVNTVVNENGTLTGHNTDGRGFVKSLKEDLGFDPAGKNILLFGAGGASRAGTVALAGAGAAQIVLANRTRERAEAMIRDIAPGFPGVRMVACTLEEDILAEKVTVADLLVNTTSVGLNGEMADFFPFEQIKASTLIYDMVYSKTATPLLEMARKQGLKASDGLGMLAAQGELAFALWTGVEPAAGLMKACLLELRSASHV